MAFRLERGRHHHQPCNLLVAPCKIADDVLDVVNAAEHGNIADELTANGKRWRQPADRPDSFHRAGFDSAEQKFRNRRTPYPGRGGGLLRSGVAAHTGIAEVAIGQSSCAKKGHLEKEVE